MDVPLEPLLKLGNVNNNLPIKKLLFELKTVSCLNEEAAAKFCKGGGKERGVALLKEVG